MKLNVEKNTIFCRDNIDILEGINSNCIDLIYLDPPFNKNKTFVAPLGSSAEGASFKDIFREEDVKDDYLDKIGKKNESLYEFLKDIRKWGDSNTYLYNYCYMVYMAVRLIEMRRVLKDTGSIYYHCDPTMSHYIKILMDIIFGEKNFRNEIVWHYRTYQGKVENYYPRKHDIIFIYLKNQNGKAIKNLEYQDNYQETVDFKRWKKYFVDGNKIKYGYHPEKDSRFIAYLNKWKKENNKKPKKDEIIYECKGYVIDDVFTDIQALDPKDLKEKIGYPTQKPLKLLERIIKASSNEGDVVLDPFCGCATTCEAAEKLNRKWIGIDTSHKTYELVKERLKENLIDFKEGSVDYQTYPPTRTDGEQGQTEGKYVYIISNLHYENLYKVGVSNDVERRLNGYQTSCPNRAFKVEYKKYFSNYREVENEIHSKFKYKAEWVEGNLKEIIDFMENYKLNK